MGSIQRWHCTKCDLQFTHHEGTGLTCNIDRYLIKDNILSGSDYPDIRALIKEHGENCYIDTGKQLYQCPHCRRITEARDLSVWLKKTDDAPARCILEYTPACPACGTKTEPKPTICPNCGAPLKSQDVGSWE